MYITRKSERHFIGASQKRTSLLHLFCLAYTEKMWFASVLTKFILYWLQKKKDKEKPKKNSYGFQLITKFNTKSWDIYKLK